MKSKRKKNLKIASFLVIIFLLLTGIQAYFESQRGIPLIPGNILIFAIININLIIILALLLVTGRTIFKIILEKRRGIIGSKFKTKLVASFIILTFIPSILLFLIAVAFIKQSIESWFSQQREKALKEAVAIVQEYTQDLMGRCERISKMVIYQDKKGRFLPPTDKNKYWRMKWILEKFRRDHNLLSLEVYDENGKRLVSAVKRGVSVFYPDDLSEKITIALAEGIPIALKEKRVFFYLYPYMDKKMAILSSVLLPDRVSRGIDVIDTVYSEFNRIRLLKEPIKRGYTFIFLMLTALIVFSALWFGIQIAKGITNPIEGLAKATERIASGDLSVRLNIKADDEIGVLVKSFNRMITELRKSRDELETRRKFMEAVLESVATGVISVDGEGIITTVNSSARKLLGIPKEVIGRPYWEVFPGDRFNSFYEIIKEMAKSPSRTEKREIIVSVGGETRHLLVGVSPIKREDGRYEGLVVVFEDITDLVKAQRASAWEEVARKMAHEIKNPLTPIKLSAQRLRRKYSKRIKDEKGVFDRSIDTIIRAVDEMKHMVDEFYRFAKLPETNPAPESFKEVVEEVLDLYRASFKGIDFSIYFSENFPPRVMIDREQMKRVFINLIDNAIDAMGGAGSLEIKFNYDEEEKRIRIEFIDTGPGIPDEEKSKVFTPYYTNKKGGTGLGLAIVDRIVADHGGYVRIKDNLPHGAVFVIELPHRV